MILKHYWRVWCHIVCFCALKWLWLKPLKYIVRLIYGCGDETSILYGDINLPRWLIGNCTFYEQQRNCLADSNAHIFEKTWLPRTQQQDTLFITTQYPGCFCFWALSDVHECLGYLWIAPSPFDKTASYESPITGWWGWLAVLCYVELKVAPTDAIWLFSVYMEDYLPLCG